MSRRWLPIAVVVCSPLLLAAGPSRTAEEREAAVRLFVEGNKHMDAGDYEGARVSFQKSCDLVQRGSVLRNLALAEMKLGKPLDALRHLRIAVAAPELTAVSRKNAQADLDAAYAATGHLSVSTTSGASVSIDGQDVGLAPLAQAVDVTVQRHEIEAHLGAQSARAQVDPKPGSIETVDLRIEVPPPAPSPAPVASQTGPAPTDPPTEREHAVSPETPSFWNMRREVGLVVAAAGVVAIGSGLYFNSAAQSHENNAQSASANLSSSSCVGASQPPACATVNNEHNAARTDVTLNRVFLTVGIVGAAAGAVMFFWPTSTSRVAIAPLATPYGGGLQLRGDF